MAAVFGVEEGVMVAESKGSAVQAVEPGYSKERHVSPGRLALEWGYAENTIRDLFRNEEGVLMKPGPSGKKFAMRIPWSVVERVHRRLWPKAKMPAPPRR